MVRKLLIGLVALVVLAIGVFVAREFLKSEEARIRERFARLASTVSKEKKEKPIAMLHLTRSFRTLFADPCTIDGARRSISGSYSPRELASLVVRGRQSFSELSLAFSDLKITLRNNRTADAVFTAFVRGTRGGGSFREAREVKATLSKEESGWVFSDIEVVQVLRK